ncbi:hypothetical protein JAAARDRAFT_116424 [Jaapia argillacea MUCL 33604]|uniref:Origin recognition complex subunit 4 n=1 Tax=Jaapia argillacea MUCL 33604 TaxID=933084 RepID=A0A067QPH6_9AGAM|nr:hypothetical protein JAAARDRAFT_116424 [Jaapia argillacea MUCL 33604]
MDSVELVARPRVTPLHLGRAGSPVPTHSKAPPTPVRKPVVPVLFSPPKRRTILSSEQQPRSVTPPPRPSTPIASSSKQILAIIPETPQRERASSPPPPPPQTPAKRHPPTPRASPSKRTKAVAAPASPPKLPRVLPSHLHPYLEAQKRAVLAALRNPPEVEQDGQTDVQGDGEDDDDDDGPPTNVLAAEQLRDLLKGTVDRGEGNSCFLIGPKGSGKTRIVENAISALPKPPIVIRLSGHVQTTDRLALREIARQLSFQTNTSYLSDVDAENDSMMDDANPFLTTADTPIISLPPPTHLPSLISILPTLARPTILILDAIDLFALHPRQSLLYTLLDTAQSIRATPQTKGLAIIGVTSRVDTINLLEKRVKSRFSGRIIRCAGVGGWEGVVKGVLSVNIAEGREEEREEWAGLWKEGVRMFLEDRGVRDVIRETFALVKDVSLLARIFVSSRLSFALTPSSPFPAPSQLQSIITVQRCPPRFPFLNALPYPSVCLLIACIHARTSGHDVFTFEMLHESFRDQVRTSLSAPIQIEGGGVGMAFEHLVDTRVFVNAGPAVNANSGREFVKYRCVLGREDVKRTVEKIGQTNLKKWFSKAH